MITQEMVKAGVRAYYDLDDVDPEFMIKIVYKAMRNAEVKSHGLSFDDKFVQKVTRYWDSVPG